MRGRVHLVAVEEGAVLGFASGGPPLRDEVIVEGDTSAYTAQLYAIYVAPAIHATVRIEPYSALPDAMVRTLSFLVCRSLTFCRCLM